MSRGLRRSIVALAAAVTVVAAIAAPASATADATLAWSAPVLVDHQAARMTDSGGIGSVACPSTSLCVGFDDLGNVVTSTEPRVISSWKTTPLRGASGLSPVGVSCPSTLLCVGLASTDHGAGRVILSTHPRTGSRAWRVERVGAVDNPEAISCPSSRLCVGVEDDGDVVTSTDPGAGFATWHVSHVDSAKSAIGKADLDGVSCASAARCVAVDDAGNVFRSSDPTGGASAWQGTQLVAHGVGDSAVSCPSSSLCVADVQGVIVRSTNPFGEHPAWMRANVRAATVTPTISCPSSSLCVASGSDLGGRLVASDAPSGQAATWRRELVDATNNVNAISCPSARFCAAVDSAGNVVVSPLAERPITVPAVIVRSESVTITAQRHGSRLTVDTGVAIGCPLGRAVCAVTGRATELAFPPRWRSIGLLHLKIRAGHHREIVFVLSRSGARMLIKLHTFDLADFQIVADRSGGLSVADQVATGLDAPGVPAGTSPG